MQALGHRYKQEAWAQAHASPPEGDIESIAQPPCADTLGTRRHPPPERVDHDLRHTRAMTTWTALDRIEPDLAERGRAIVASTTNAVLATLLSLIHI